MPKHLPDHQTVSQLIADARSAQKVSTRDFADAVGVSHTSVIQWERGIAEPDDARLASWAKDRRAWVQALAVNIMTTRYRALLTALLPTPEVA